MDTTKLSAEAQTQLDKIAEFIDSFDFLDDEVLVEIAGKLDKTTAAASGDSIGYATERIHFDLAALCHSTISNKML